MRTTVELPDEYHRRLTHLAALRGQRGFSELVAEAVGNYLADLDAAEVDEILGIEGALDAAAAHRMTADAREARGTWRTA